MTDVIKFEKQGAIGVITIDSPPANAISFAVKKGLGDSFQACIDDDSCKGIVVTGGGRMFVAGADISEFGKPTPEGVPELENIIRKLSENISNNKKILESICDHQWKITRDRCDDHSKKSCHICGLEKY